MTTSRHILMLPVADERGASTRYRVLAHRPALEDAGFTTEVRYPLDLAHRGPQRLVLRVADVLRDVYGETRADLWFVHRKTYPAPFVAPVARRVVTENAVGSNVNASVGEAGSFDSSGAVGVMFGWPK